MEDPSFIPSAVSEPRRALHMCDNMCREEGSKFYQFVAIVAEEGGAARTINLCKQRDNVRLLKQGERQVTASKWRAMVDQKAFTRQAVGSIWHGTPRAQNVGL